MAGASDPAGARPPYVSSIDALVNRLREVERERDHYIDETRQRIAEADRLLEQQRMLRREIRAMQVAAERRNRALDAMRWVWCDGGCELGVNRFSDEKLTREEVEIISRNTERVIRWFNNSEFKILRHARSQILEDVRHRDAQPADAGLPGSLPGFDRDSV